MTQRVSYLVPIALAGALATVSVGSAQTVQFGAKIGINTTSVNAVSDYYDWLLCCSPPHVPIFRIDESRRAGLTAGGFLAVPVNNWFGLQGELLFSEKRHHVEEGSGLRPTFERDYVEAAALTKFEFPTLGGNHLYVTAGPVLGFRVRERFHTSDPRVVRGDPETDIYVVQALPFVTAELLRTIETSVAVAGGFLYRRLLLEVRFTQGLQSIFKDRRDVRFALLQLGYFSPSLDLNLPEFAPIFELAKSRELALLAGFRF